MTDKTKSEITSLIKLTMGFDTTSSGLPVESLTDSIAELVDTEFGKAVIEACELGPMLDAVGLEIRSKA